jgi:hypothetical protein
MRAMGTGKYLGGNPVNLRRGRAWQDMAKERQVNKKICNAGDVSSALKYAKH